MGPWIAAAAANGFLALAMGALAAHGLQGRIAPEALGWVETAARIQAVHALALLGVAILMDRSGAGVRSLAVAAWAFFLGMAIFCGALYALALTGWRALGGIVPLGGVGILLGWGALFVYGLGSRTKAGER